MKTVDHEIKKALKAKGYTWNEIKIKSYLGYTHLFGVYLDGEFKEVYNANKKEFVD